MTNEELQARVMAIEAAYFSDSMQEISELTRERDEARRIARRLSKALVNALDNLGRDGEPLRTRMEGDAALAEYWASIDGKRERKPFGWVCQLGSENIHDVWIGADPHPAGMSDELLKWRWARVFSDGSAHLYSSKESAEYAESKSAEQAEIAEICLASERDRYKRILDMTT